MINNKKYLVILPTDRIGGAERVAMNLVTHLLNVENVSVRVIFLCGFQSGRWEGIANTDSLELVYLDSKRERLGIFKCIMYLLKNPDIYNLVYTTHAHVNAFAALLRNVGIVKSKNHIARESTVIFDRFFGFKRFLAKVLYMFYRNIDLIICQTDYMKFRFLEETSTVSSDRVVCLPNPLSVESVINQASQINFNFKLDSSVFNIVQVGRLVDIKNHVLAIKAIALLRDKFDFVFWIIGDGPNRLKLEVLTSELHISDRVIFTGNMENPYYFMANADLGILTSVKEGFPNVIVEMMAAGTKNIITTNCSGGLSELPGITVIDSLEDKCLSAHVENAISSRYDNRSIYLKHAESRDVRAYWNQISTLFGPEKL